MPVVLVSLCGAIIFGSLSSKVKNEEVSHILEMVALMCFISFCLILFVSST